LERLGSLAIHLQQQVKAANNIEIIDSVVSDDEMKAIINACHVLMSLHRSEGFGLHLAEAMAAGKPVIATDWSGNTDS
jgi:glycosyltransferase involved in cell wall biosynthesis